MSMHQYFLHNLSIHVSQNKTALHVLCIHEKHILQSNLTTAFIYTQQSLLRIQYAPAISIITGRPNLIIIILTWSGP